MGDSSASDSTIETTTNILGPPVSYVDILDISSLEVKEAEEEAIQTGEGRPYCPLRPSAAGKCTRELAYQLMEFTGQKYYPKDPMEPTVTRLLDVGHYIENSFKNQFRRYAKEYFQVKYEQQGVYGFRLTSKKFDELNMLIEGSLDWCFVSKGHKGLIDAKTKKDKFHKWFKSDWDGTDDKLKKMESVEVIGSSEQAYWIEDLEAFINELNDPFFEANFWQINFYCNSDWAKAVGIDHGAILQYNKNDSRIREIRFKPSARLYERTQGKFQAAVDACDEGDVTKAAADFPLGSIKCAFCPYVKDCHGASERDALKKFFNTLPNKSWPKDTDRMTKELSARLEDNYAEFIEEQGLIDRRKKTEELIIKDMLDNGIKKIRFSDGLIYELKFLKSPREHYELRRSKI